MQATLSSAALIDLLQDSSADSDRRRFADDVRTGLSAFPKHLSSQYFYDAVGMKLFQKIMDLPEYYLTRCEHEIFLRHREAIRSAMPDGPLNVLDLGSGDGTKTRILLEHFVKAKTPLNYFPIDISRDTLHALSADLSSSMPTLPVHAVAAEYFDALRWIGRHERGHNLVLFLGSNIGNFTMERARDFLRRLHASLRDRDRVLIGFDLQKDPRVISRAYDDAEGVTARFNLNLLDRMNRELGANFDPTAFRHYAYYDEIDAAAKSFLVSTRAQRVTIAALEAAFSFDAWESIHTEDSRKFSPRQIATLARECGFSIAAEYTDDACQFVDSLWVREPVRGPAE